MSPFKRKWHGLRRFEFHYQEGQFGGGLLELARSIPKKDMSKFTCLDNIWVKMPFNGMVPGIEPGQELFDCACFVEPEYPPPHRH